MPAQLTAKLAFLAGSLAIFSVLRALQDSLRFFEFEAPLAVVLWGPIAYGTLAVPAALVIRKESRRNLLWLFGVGLVISSIEITTGVFPFRVCNVLTPVAIVSALAAILRARNSDPGAFDSPVAPS